MKCNWETCERDRKGPSILWCEAHYQRLRAGKDMAAPIKEKNVGSFGYRGAHRAVERVRGKASEHICVCGCGEQAQEWALWHDAPVVYVDMRPGLRERQYSREPYWYLPMTKSHHRKYDGIGFKR